eukprot:scaffold7197_cov88-Skeletonema_menzelii.AAC.11
MTVRDYQVEANLSPNWGQPLNPAELKAGGGRLFLIVHFSSFTVSMYYFAMPMPMPMHIYYHSTVYRTIIGAFLYACR